MQQGYRVYDTRRTVPGICGYVRDFLFINLARRDRLPIRTIRFGHGAHLERRFTTFHCRPSLTRTDYTGIKLQVRSQLAKSSLLPRPPRAARSSHPRNYPPVYIAHPHTYTPRPNTDRVVSLQEQRMVPAATVIHHVSMPPEIKSILESLTGQRGGTSFGVSSNTSSFASPPSQPETLSRKAGNAPLTANRIDTMLNKNAPGVSPVKTRSGDSSQQTVPLVTMIEPGPCLPHRLETARIVHDIPALKAR